MKDVFCANEQKVTQHKGTVDVNGEFLFTCQGCGRFLKFPANTTNINDLITKHEGSNKGQVSIAIQEAKLAELMKAEGEKIEVVSDPVEFTKIPQPTEPIVEGEVIAP